ncbi:MAG: LUD domain-containing protein [Nanoarchaeota archaeon]|nr:LUD domain-containing protein [Nanoarchaeota archaeon]
MDYIKISSKNVIDKTVTALKDNGINVHIAKNSDDAKKIVFNIIPVGAEVMTMTSVTLDTLGISTEINNSGNYDSVRKKLDKMDRKTQNDEMQKLGAAPNWAVGSVHAITEDGKIMIASNTGSQLPAYVYGANNVIFVAGMHKIVKDMDQGFKRIYEHSLVLESERARKAYGVLGSSVNKVLIINKEIKPNRINLVLVPEVIGF